MTVRPGRRPGDNDTRATILAAARNQFARNSFDHTSVRSIAAEAGVDPALIHHYFGTKRELFLAAIALPVDPADILAPVLHGPLENLGTGLVRAVITLWDSEFSAIGAAIVRSAFAEDSPTLLGSFVSTIVFGAVKPLVDDPIGSADKRIALAGSQIGGMVLLRYIVCLPEAVALSIDEVVSGIGPTVQHYLTGDLALSE